ncbi:MAG TPA: chemotaxis protein CheW [Alphaproteobacteria bacterium]|nr:chemotaxis protein CheW [Alphaproteobacteria bacterium]
MELGRGIARRGAVAAPVPMDQFVCFAAGGGSYAVDILAVREIRAWTPASPLPEMPPHMIGILDLRGAMVPVFDLARRFGGPATRPTPTHVVLVVAVAGGVAGLLVDAVSDIVAVPAGGLLPAPEIERRADAAYLDGLIPQGEGLIAVLGPSRLFDLRGLAAPGAGG